MVVIIMLHIHRKVFLKPVSSRAMSSDGLIFHFLFCSLMVIIFSSVMALVGLFTFGVGQVIIFEVMACVMPGPFSAIPASYFLLSLPSLLYLNRINEISY
jgi:hypothetical protein